VAHPLLLVVEDDPAIAELVARVLRGVVAEVRTAGDAAEAPRLLGEGAPDALIVDVGLPGRRNGFDLLREVRAGSDVPVMMLTALATPEDQERGLDLGADYYVTKPFSPAVLRARVGAMLRRAAT
jgi:DNA-binding response OmpR family regulator